MGKTMQQQQDHRDDHLASSDGEAVAVEPLQLLMEAQRMVEELRACLQLHQSSSSPSPTTSPADHLAPVAAGGAGAPLQLVERISEALSRAIMLLPLLQSTGGCWPPVMARAASPACRGNGGCKRRACRAELRRGGCRKELRSSIDEYDGYSWRKYGQKHIFAAKYPRSYYWCKHRKERQCPATRQVQRSETNPSVFEFTYIGDHTCTEPRQEATAATTAATLDEHHPPSPAHPAGSVKHEAMPPHRHSAGSLRRDPDHLVPSGHDGGGAPVHCLQYLDVPSPFMAFDGHAGVSSLFDFDGAYYYAAAGNDELAAASSPFGAFATSADAAMIWEWEITSDDTST